MINLMPVQYAGIQGSLAYGSCKIHVREQHSHMILGTDEKQTNYKETNKTFIKVSGRLLCAPNNIS